MRPRRHLATFASMLLLPQLRPIVLAAAFSSRCLGQATAAAAANATLPSYDAGTVRLNTAGGGNSDVDVNATTFVARNVVMRELLEMAFDVHRGQIFGIPAWADKARFDINAKITDPDLTALNKLTPEQHRLVFQRFLADRFALKWHIETRTIPTYELTVARGGPKMQQSAHCGEEDDSTHQNNTDLTGTCLRMRFFTDQLSNQMDRPVVDKTGLAAHYDFHLRWSREETRADVGTNGSDADAPPPLFTALEEQLGLKMVSGKDPVRVLVIDELKAPRDN